MRFATAVAKPWSGDQHGRAELLASLECSRYITLDWNSDPALRRRSNAGLNKGEAKHALARAVFFHRLGEITPRSRYARVTRCVSGMHEDFNVG
jgi:hypothetical protein